MKLLFFINTLNGGGAERVLSNLTNELVKRGHEITIAINERQIAYELDSRIRIISAPQRRWYQGNNPFKRIIRNIALNKRNRKHTKRVIQMTGPEVIISFMRCNLWSIIRYHKNVPIIHSEHNAYDRRLGLNFYFHRFFVNRFFNKVCVLTSFDQGYALAKGLKNTVVMPNPNTFLPISEEEFDMTFDKRKNVLVCGRISAWRIKGFDLAIKAFARVAQNFPGVDLDIAGSGDDHSKNYLLSLAKKEGVGNRVHLLGQQKDIENVYKQHKVFLLSSRTEGFPMVVTEAMSIGTPCVSFERLSSSIIVNGIDGLLVKDLDVSGLSKALETLLYDDKLRRTYGLEAIKNISRFSSSNVATRWEEMIKSILK